MTRRAHHRRTLAALTLAVVPVVTGVIGCDRDSTGVTGRGGDPPSVRRASLTIVSGDSQRAEVATTLEQPLVVVLRDPAGVAIPSQLVRLIRDGIVADSTTTTATGVASLRWTLTNKAEVQHVLARGTGVGEFTEVVFTATATAAAPAAIRISTRTTLAAPATALDTVFARVSDRFDNPVPSAPVTWSVVSGGGSVRALSASTDAQGIARAILTLGPEVGGNVLVVESASLTDRLAATGSLGLAARRVVVGATHSCAIDVSGIAYCWGSNRVGELGIGTTDNAAHPLPVRVAGGLTFTTLTAGSFHTCGLTAEGAAYCWGYNYAGQLGSTPAATTVPSRVAGPDTFVAIAAGGYHTCGLTSAGLAMCWGDGTLGQHGDGRDRTTVESYNPLGRASPGLVAGARSFVALTANNLATCAITRDGETWCWGANGSYELGGAWSSVCRIPADFYYEEYDWPCSTSPVRVALPGSLASISSSSHNTCGVTTSAALVCWGWPLERPTVVPGVGVSEAWTLGQIACGLGEAGLSCWRLQNFPGRAFPVVRPHDGDVELVDLEGDTQTFCGLSRGAVVLAYCWGNNEAGQLGDGTTQRRTAPGVVGLPR